MPEIDEIIKKAVALIEEAAKEEALKPVDGSLCWDSKTADETRAYCVKLLEAAQADGFCGCLLCQS
jgi:hypothetical protein